MPDQIELFDIIGKLQFFGGQRAGRELWNDKPREVQDADIENFNRDLDTLRAALPRWISVEERLPEPFVSVLVQMPGEKPHPTVREGYISNEGVWVAGHFRRDPDEVTHWAEMPEPPKEGAHDI